MKKIILFIVLHCFGCLPAFSQNLIAHTLSTSIADTSINYTKPAEQIYNVGNDRSFVYSNPGNLSALTHLPSDLLGIAIEPFKKKNIKPILIIGAATALLMLADEPISDGVHQFSKNIHFHSEEQYINLIHFKVGNTEGSVFKAPRNINTGLYEAGQGLPDILIAGGLFAYGKANNDYRAVSTAHELTETLILVGITTQLIKRISGRQSPIDATQSGGEWNFFPSFKAFQTHTPTYDAFPSGHLASMIGTIVVLSENYPEKKYIKPIGFLFTGIVGLSMINNNVHWASDFPLAIGLGYLCSKQVVKGYRKIQASTASKKSKSEVFYTFNYSGRIPMPGIKIIY